MSLTKVPLTMLDPGENAKPNDEVVYNGSEIETQTQTATQLDDKYVIRGSFDPETGSLELVRNDDTIIQIPGFMTVHNIGIGQQGTTGPKGAAGIAGRNGKDGRPGIAGCTGPKGDMGPAGPAGPVGPTGPRGLDGPTGPSGEAGVAGAAGQDGERPVLTSTVNGSFETVTTGRLIQWGRFTDTTAGDSKSLVFPEALTDVAKHHSLLISWVNPASNVANKVKIADISTGYATLLVETSLLDLEPDGSGGTQPVASTGWDFYWLLVGE